MERELQQRLLQAAYRYSLRSNDPSTQVGALLVEPDGRSIAEGWNAPPEGIAETAERWNDRDLKLKVTEHAERMAIFNAVKLGRKVSGMTLVCPWLACCDCARAIIGCGIKRCLGHKQALDRTPNRWREVLEFALSLFKEAQVEVIWYDGKVNAAEPVRLSGETWRP